jgi:hypothetical protein
VSIYPDGTSLVMPDILSFPETLPSLKTGASIPARHNVGPLPQFLVEAPVMPLPGKCTSGASSSITITGSKQQRILLVPFCRLPDRKRNLQREATHGPAPLGPVTWPSKHPLRHTSLAIQDRHRAPKSRLAQRPRDCSSRSNGISAELTALRPAQSSRTGYHRRQK